MRVTSLTGWPVLSPGLDVHAELPQGGVEYRGPGECKSRQLRHDFGGEVAGIESSRVASWK